MKVLSFRQPWACLVVHFGKTIENRTWGTSFRGEFLIHAAKGMTRRELGWAYEFATDVMGDACPTEERLRSMLQFGGVVGRARLVDIIPPCGAPGGRCSCEAAQSFGRSWHMAEQYGFVLADVVPIPFRPCRGRLGFFEAPMESGPKLSRRSRRTQ